MILNIKFNKFIRTIVLCCIIFFLFKIITTELLAQQYPPVVSTRDQPRLSQSSTYASEKSSPRTLGSDFAILLSSVGTTLSAPLHWDTKERWKAAGFFAACGASFFIDDEVRDRLLPNRSDIYDRIERIGYLYGSPGVAAPAALVIYFSGSLSDNNWMRDTGLMMTGLLVSIGIVQQPVRIIAGRARPFSGNKNTSFDLFGGISQQKSSLVSGHSAIAFGFSRILAHQIDQTLATIPLYCLASLTPLARFYKDTHWFSDILMGTGMGIFMANSIIRLQENNTQSENKMTLFPTANGIYLSFRF